MYTRLRLACCVLIARQWQCSRTGFLCNVALPHARSRNTVEPSTHNVWSFQGHPAGRCTRQLSISSARFVDVDDNDAQKNKTLRSRGLRRGVIRGRQGFQKSNQDSLKGETAMQDKWAISGDVVGPREYDLRETSLDETDELIDIHDPQGKENVNEFDAQYFGDGMLPSSPSSLSAAYIVDEPSLSEKTEVNASYDDDLHEIDLQYFGNAVTYANPKKRKSQYVSRDIEPRTWSVDTDVNEFDKQYFVTSNENSTHQDTTKTHQQRDEKLKHNESLFLDTSLGEESILQELKRKDQLDAQMAALAKDEVPNYEPHEKATTIKFRKKIDSDKHETVRFEDEKDNMLFDISKELEKELKAERKLQEKMLREKQEEEVFEAVEPEVKEVLLSLKKKKQHSPQKLSDKADPSIETSHIPCSGCGAFLHCSSVDKPGFMPKEQFLKFMGNVEQGNYAETMKAVCIRCWNLIRQKEALNVNVNQDDYMNIIKTIRCVSVFYMLLIMGTVLFLI